MGRKRTAVLITTGVAAAMAAGLVIWRLPEANAEPSAVALPGGTAKITKRDLVVTEEVQGHLGYADGRDVTAHRAGVVTSLAAEGSTVRQGQALFAVDREPTVLLFGSVPFYRTLNTAAADGPDVRQLETALKALGYGAGLTVDDHFSSATADAVEDWESDLGRADPDGTVEPGDLVFAAGSLRVASRKTVAGAQVQGPSPVLTVTSTGKVADVDLDVDKTNLVAPGGAVTVELPDGKKTPGKVASVGTDPKAGDNPTVSMVVTLGKPADAKRFDSGSVTVTIEQSREKDALSVPVSALLALSGGGYALQVVDATATAGYRLTAVEVGTVTDDFAGVSGAGVRAGVDVVVPA